ncbi:MAG: alpha/beta fold hydrolase [Kineosporiaceae bacterium]
MPFVLVHSAGFDSRVWEPVLPHLHASALAVDLPGRRPGGAVVPAGETTGWTTLDDYADSVASDVLATGWEDVVLVGHGFAAVTLPRVVALVPGLIGRLVFVSGALPRHGEPVRPPDPRHVRGAVTDLPTEAAARARALTVPEPPRVGDDLADLTGLRYPVPRSWVRLERDRVVPPARQDVYAERAGCAEVVGLDAPHLAMIAAPRDLAAVLDRMPAHPAAREETLALHA